MTVSEDALGTVRGRFGDGKAAADRLAYRHRHRCRQIRRPARRRRRHPGGRALRQGGAQAAVRYRRAGVRRRGGLALSRRRWRRRRPAPACSTATTLAARRRQRRDARGGDQGYGKSAAEIPAAAYDPRTRPAMSKCISSRVRCWRPKSQPLGVVTGIVGQSRMRVMVTGEAGHAGTVPMALRHDALAGAAEMVLAIEAIARSIPRTAWSAPSAASRRRPARSMSSRARVGVHGRIAFAHRRAAAGGARAVRGRSAAHRRQRAGWNSRSSRSMRSRPRTARRHCRMCLPRRSPTLGHTPIRLPSGAGHDAQVMARLCPSAMLFVRCRGGISHNPAEFASVADMGLAIAALIRFIERFDQERSA